MRCRGAACRSRRCTGDSCRVSIQWQEPIVSVAAVTAQPLAALPPYGCGVPFTGVERLWQLHISARLRRPCNAPGLSLRGGRRPTWQSRRTRVDNRATSANSEVHTILTMACTDCKCLPEIATGAKRPRNDNSGVHTILAMACTDRQHCAGPGCPLPCNRTTKSACCSCSRRSFYLLRDFVLCSYWRQPAMRLSESDMNCFSFSSKVCGPLGALS